MSSQLEANGLLSQYVTLTNATILGVLLVVSYAVKCRFWGPLKHVPGPWWSYYTQIPDYYHTFSGDRALYLHSLHQRYGNTVRVGPNLIGVSGAEAIRTVFGTSFTTPFSKDPTTTILFNLTRMPNGENMLALNHPSDALRRRKQYGNVFSRGNVLGMQDLYRICFENHIAKVEALRESSPTNVVDILKCNRALTLDVITEAAFGGLYKGSEDPDRLMMLLTNTMKANLVQHNFGNFIYKLLMRIPWKGMDWVRAKEDYLGISTKATNEYMVNRKEKSKNIRKDVIGQLLTYDLPQDAIEAEVVAIIFGGTDTTANSATFTTIEILKHPEIHAKLVEELFRVFPQGEYRLLDALDYAKVEECKYLTKVIKEGLRQHPLAPGPAMRLVPDEGSTLNGYRIPGKVSIFAQSETTNHDPSAFPDPHCFDPERWEVETPEMHALFLAFGSGPRICPGENLAMMELHMLLALLFRNYEVSLAPEGDTQFTEFWLRTMKHGKLLLKLDPRSA